MTFPNWSSLQTNQEWVEWPFSLWPFKFLHHMLFNDSPNFFMALSIICKLKTGSFIKSEKFFPCLNSYTDLLHLHLLLLSFLPLISVVSSFFLFYDQIFSENGFWHPEYFPFTENSPTSNQEVFTKKIMNFCFSFLNHNNL